MSASNLMCPFCGERMACPRGLTPIHYLAEAPCAGSEQNPRCIDSDMRPLWSGQPSPARLTVLAREGAA